MGFIHNIGSEILGIEERRESIKLHELYEGVYDASKCKHIFAFQNGHVEITKEMMLEVLEFFDIPENRAMLKQ